MKLKSTLLAAMLAVFAVSTATTFAADDVKTEKAEAAKTDKKPAKKMKKHSHMGEKTGMPMSEPAAGGTKKKDPKQTHDHTLDKH
jgi:hypothetical protein